jgi:hypothetical protein
MVSSFFTLAFGLAMAAVVVSGCGGYVHGVGTRVGGGSVLHQQKEGFQLGTGKNLQ